MAGEGSFSFWLGLALRNWLQRPLAALACVATLAVATAAAITVDRTASSLEHRLQQTVAGTHVIVGAAGSADVLLASSLFQTHKPGASVPVALAAALARHPAVEWAIPMGTWDHHAGYPVVVVAPAFFRQFRYGKGQPLNLSHGSVITNQPRHLYDAVAGSEAASGAGLMLGDAFVVQHRTGHKAEHSGDTQNGGVHTDRPLRLVGQLEPTGTPLDRMIVVAGHTHAAVHAPPGMAPARASAAPNTPGRALSPEPVAAAVPVPSWDHAHAVLLGLKDPAMAPNVQRFVASWTPADDTVAPGPAASAAKPARRGLDRGTERPAPRAASAQAMAPAGAASAEGHAGLARVDPAEAAARLVAQAGAPGSDAPEVLGAVQAPTPSQWAAVLPLVAQLPGGEVRDLWARLSTSWRRGLSLSAGAVALALGLMAVIQALSVRRRQTQWHVLRGMGATASDLATLVFLECLWIAVLGIGLGIMVSLGALVAVEPWLRAQHGVSQAWAAPWLSLWVLLALVSLGALLAGVVPGWLALRQGSGTAWPGSAAHA